MSASPEELRDILISSDLLRKIFFKHYKLSNLQVLITMCCLSYGLVPKGLDILFCWKNVLQPNKVKLYIN